MPLLPEVVETLLAALRTEDTEVEDGTHTPDTMNKPLRVLAGDALLSLLQLQIDRDFLSSPMAQVQIMPAFSTDAGAGKAGKVQVLVALVNQLVAAVTEEEGIGAHKGRGAKKAMHSSGRLPLMCLGSLALVAEGSILPHAMTVTAPLIECVMQSLEEGGATSLDNHPALEALCAVVSESE